MNSEFWQARWQENRIGFNQSEIKPLLIKNFPALKLSSGSRIFVPLCGKSIDMAWLASQGYDVVGVELVESAVQAFFTEHGMSSTIKNIATQHTNNLEIKCFQGLLSGQRIELWVADIFALTPEDIGQVDAVYDRAALIALPPNMRPRYSEQVSQLSQGAPQCLFTLNYDQSERNGPPFSISSDQIKQYYGSNYKITELEGKPAILNAAPELAVTEHVWLLE